MMMRWPCITLPSPLANPDVPSFDVRNLAYKKIVFVSLLKSGNQFSDFLYEEPPRVSLNVFVRSKLWQPCGPPCLDQGPLCYGA
jgi:hypothetical protein